MEKANEKAVNEILEPQKLYNSEQIDLHGNKYNYFIQI
jgi:hypothetical protein